MLKPGTYTCPTCKAKRTVALPATYLTCSHGAADTRPATLRNEEGWWIAAPKGSRLVLASSRKRGGEAKAQG